MNWNSNASTRRMGVFMCKQYYWLILGLLSVFLIYSVLISSTSSQGEALTSLNFNPPDQTWTRREQLPKSPNPNPANDAATTTTRWRFKLQNEAMEGLTGTQNDETWSLDKIRTKHLLPYNSDIPTNYSGDSDEIDRVSKVVANRFGFKRNGFFVECGANDGAFLSNTLLLERTYGWTGLLVEADPAILPILKKRNRHAWVADVCLATEPHPMRIVMHAHEGGDGLSFIPNNVVPERLEGEMNEEYFGRKFEVQCFPLDMLMAAINRTEIDYLSLDVEGVELGILRTIPFDRVRIKLISLEAGGASWREKELLDFMESVGYKRVQKFRQGMYDDLYELPDVLLT